MIILFLAKTKKFGDNKYRPNTVTTISEADNYLEPKNDEILLYNSFSPTFSFRVRDDILRYNYLIKSSKNKAIFINQSQIDLLEDLKQQKIDNNYEIESLYIKRKDLKFYDFRSKFVINRHIKKLKNDNYTIDKFTKLYYSSILDNLARSIYSKNVYFKSICEN